jgi:hypothetical protein
MVDDPRPIFLRENYERPASPVDDHAVRIAEGSAGPEWPEGRVETVGSTPVGYFDDDEDDGVTAPLHPAVTLLASAAMLAAIAIAGGLLAALVMRALP